MRIGGSLLLIAIGAILRWAITADVRGVDLNLIGVILMIVGAVALVVSLIMLASRRRTDVIHSGITSEGIPTEERTSYVAPTRTDEHW